MTGYIMGMTGFVAKWRNGISIGSLPIVLGSTPGFATSKSFSHFFQKVNRSFNTYYDFIYKYLLTLI